MEEDSDETVNDSNVTVNNSDEIITLVFGEHRIEVNKRQLINKCTYFASLFSHNFSDSHENQHVVNYDFSIATLQIFVNWVHDNEEPVVVDNLQVKDSISIFLDHFNEMRELLHASIIYGAEMLTEELTDILITNWLHADKVTAIWSTAREFGLSVLADVAFAACLNLFEQLPVECFFRLHEKDFYLLIRNINIECSPARFRYIQERWLECNWIAGVPIPPSSKGPKFLDGAVLCDHSSWRNMSIYVWDEHNLSRITRLRSQANELTGARVVARGFNIYMIGGEKILGSNRFNKYVWRYCLISKKWYNFKRLPVPRRHMVAVVIKDKLVLVGGVGQYRVKLDTVDLLNLQTGVWTVGEKIEETFTDVPPHCVIQYKLYIATVCIHVYDPEINGWGKFPLPGTVLLTGFVAFANNSTLFFIDDDKSERNQTTVSRITATQDPICENAECSRDTNDHILYDDLSIHSINRFCELRLQKYQDCTIALMRTPHYKLTNLHLQIVKAPEMHNFSVNHRAGYFKVIDPNSLYDTE